MSYNTELQTINTNLQAVLTKVQNLSGVEEEDTTNKETWTLIDSSGNTIEEKMTVFSRDEVVAIEYYDQSYGLGENEGIWDEEVPLLEDCVITNKVPFIRKDIPYETTIRAVVSPTVLNYVLVEEEPLDSGVVDGLTFYANDNICKISYLPRTSYGRLSVRIEETNEI